jgi:hypothetical protein
MVKMLFDGGSGGAKKSSQPKSDYLDAIARSKAAATQAAALKATTPNRATANNLRTENRAAGKVPGYIPPVKEISPGPLQPKDTKIITPPAAKDPVPDLKNTQSSTPPSLADSSSSTTTETPAVKSAPIDTVQFIDETFNDQLIIDLLFENIGGQELLTIARNDTVNGQNVVYQPIKNLGILQEIYNPTTLLRLQETSDKFFSNFTINLREKIPNVGSGENGKNYYLDFTTGEGVIEFVNIRSNEQVEVQIISAGIIEDVGI